LRPFVAAGDAAPDHDLAARRLEHAPLDDVDVVDPCGNRLDAAHQDVFSPAVSGAEERLDDQLRRGQRLAVVVALDALEIAQLLERFERELAGAVVRRPLAQHDQVARVAGGDQGLLEAGDETHEQRGGEHHQAMTATVSRVRTRRAKRLRRL